MKYVILSFIIAEKSLLANIGMVMGTVTRVNNFVIALFCGLSVI